MTVVGEPGSSSSINVEVSPVDMLEPYSTLITVNLRACFLGEETLASDGLGCEVCNGYLSQDNMTCVTCADGQIGNHVTRTCGDCAAGTFAIPELNRCEPCPEGHYQRESGADSCDKCPEGKYSDVTGAVECKICDPGTYQGLLGQVACTPCAPGHHASERGQSACSKCSIKTYSSVHGAVECDNCPAFTNNYQDAAMPPGGIDNFVPDSLSHCFPEIGYYGMSGQPGTECPEGGICCECLATDSGGDRDLCTCISGSELPYPEDGFIRSVRIPHLMLRCPLDGACAGSEKLVHPDTQIQPSSDGTDDGYANATESELLEANYAGNCNEGYEERLCGQCAADHYKNAGRCNECHGQASKALLFILLLVLILAGLAYGIKSGIDFFKSGAVAIAIDWVQTQATLYQYEIGWPSSINGMLKLFSVAIFNVEVLATECVMDTDFYESYILKLASPIIVLSLIVIMYVSLSLAVQAKQINAGKVVLYQAYLVNAVLFIINLVYPSMVSVTLSIFHCQTFSDGTSYLNAEPAIECGTATWWGYAGSFGIIGILFYLIGIPALCYAILRRNKGSLVDPLFKKQFGALYIVYSTDYYYWEVVLMIKKLCMLLLVVIFPDSVLLQVIGALLVLAASIGIGFVTSPFQFAHNNLLDNFASFSCYATLGSGLFFNGGNLSDNEENTVIAVIMMAYFAIALLLMHGIVYDFLAYHAESLAELKWARSMLMENAFVDKTFNTKVAVTDKTHWAKKDKMIGDKLFKQIIENAEEGSKSLLPPKATEDTTFVPEGMQSDAAGENMLDIAKKNGPTTYNDFRSAVTKMIELHHTMQIWASHESPTKVAGPIDSASQSPYQGTAKKRDMVSLEDLLVGKSPNDHEGNDLALPGMGVVAMTGNESPRLAPEIVHALSRLETEESGTEVHDL
ncbi:hypothetical protein CYMTET_38930 [Cymbomonas tetramitiformis]|uniref:Tyrosine-protein kinase ephrin type A/B receptor-like domain-containing protein n=1 Tax=Cymbomonas tetramitiformis TaxID=36881 RepID=A0AAE0F4S1_9CHLO|nr:hypothetical protein CYMTET_38930 [Cymbomonas tetramitiformis]